jgi:hypothetical protein
MSVTNRNDVVGPVLVENPPPDLPSAQPGAEIPKPPEMPRSGLPDPDPGEPMPGGLDESA